MILSEFSIRRPVFATVLSLLLVILGLAALVNLPVRQYPENLFSKRSGFRLLQSKLQNGYPKMTIIEIQ